MKRLVSVLVILTLTIGLSASGCATVTPRPTPDTTQATIDQAAVLTSAMKTAVAFANQKRDDAQALYDKKVITAPTMQKINQAGNVLSIKTLEFVAFAKTVTSDPSLRVTASALLDTFKEFIDSLSPAGISGEDIRKALAAFFSYLGVQ